MKEKKPDIQQAAQHDRLTELLRLWASRYSQPVENLSAGRLVELIEHFLREGKGQAALEQGQPKRRWDHEKIESIIAPGSRVLDLGCGGGELLASLVKRLGVRAQGVELDPSKVFECVRRGIPVFQTDLDQGLAGIKADGTYAQIYGKYFGAVPAAPASPASAAAPAPAASK